MFRNNSTNKRRQQDSIQKTRQQTTEDNEFPKQQDNKQTKATYFTQTRQQAYEDNNVQNNARQQINEDRQTVNEDRQETNKNRQQTNKDVQHTNEDVKLLSTNKRTSKRRQHLEREQDNTQARTTYTTQGNTQRKTIY